MTVYKDYENADGLQLKTLPVHHLGSRYLRVTS